VSGALYFPHEFEGEVVHHELGTMRYTVVFLPEDIAATLPFDGNPRLRFSGEVGEAPISAAWQPVRGRWYAMLSKPLLKATGLGVGDVTTVRFRIEPQDSVERAPELEAVLDADPALRRAWDALTPGLRRGQTHRLLTAKTSPTRLKRLGEIVAALEGRAEWPMPPKRRNT
jgi:hypothetical protein